jgi:hypothetical protein
MFYAYCRLPHVHLFYAAVTQLIWNLAVWKPSMLVDYYVSKQDNWVFITSVSYSGTPGFNFRQFWLIYLLLFLSSYRKISEECLRLGQDRLLIYCSLITISYEAMHSEPLIMSLTNNKHIRKIEKLYWIEYNHIPKVSSPTACNTDFRNGLC